VQDFRFFVRDVLDSSVAVQLFEDALQVGPVGHAVRVPLPPPRDEPEGAAEAAGLHAGQLAGQLLPGGGELAGGRSSACNNVTWGARD
jgi:hypothetical protein